MAFAFKVYWTGEKAVMDSFRFSRTLVSAQRRADELPAHNKPEPWVQRACVMSGQHRTAFPPEGWSPNLLSLWQDF